MTPTLVFEMQRLIVKELWNNNIQKPFEIIKITGFSKSIEDPKEYINNSNPGLKF